LAALQGQKVQGTMDPAWCGGRKKRRQKVGRDRRKRYDM